MLVSSSPCSETCRCNEHAQNFDIKAAVDEPPHWKHRTTQQRRSRQQRKRSPTRAGPKVRLKANRGPSTSRSSCLRNQLRVQRSPENEATSLVQNVRFTRSSRRYARTLFLKLPCRCRKRGCSVASFPEHVVSLTHSLMGGTFDSLWSCFLKKRLVAQQFCSSM